MGLAQLIRRRCFAVLLTILIVLASSYERIEATRVLREDTKVKMLLLESLPKGPVPPSKPSPCTHIPNRGGSGRCAAAMMEMNFVGGRVRVTPSVFPDYVVQVGVAADTGINLKNFQDPPRE